MLDFKEEQRKKGVHYDNLVETAKAADPVWRDAPPSVRKRFEEMAKKAKQKYNLADMKYTSTGVPLVEIEKREREIQEAQEMELEDIKNLVTLNCVKGNILTEDFYVMDVNFYCKAGTHYVIGESTVLRFNLRDGIIDNYHEIINPGSIPTGYAHDVKLGSSELGLTMPDESLPRSNYMQILANIVDYLKQQNSNSNILPPIFTIPEKVQPIQDFILQMCSKAAEDETLFRVYKLDTLFYNLINAIKTCGNEGFPKESLALVQLKKDLFKYNPGLGCEHHEEEDKSVECTLSRTKRWVFTILDSCCPIAGIDVVPGRHLPFDYDMDGILSMKEQKRGRSAPSIAGIPGLSSCNTSTVNESLNDSTVNSTAEFSVSGVKNEKRVHKPLRMPKTDYSQTIRPAPELTESNFPKLTAGHGRGRGMSASFSKLKLDK
ncbi:unnamed protein product, partial [Iphiclides podalirius]